MKTNRRVESFSRITDGAFLELRVAGNCTDFQATATCVDSDDPAGDRTWSHNQLCGPAAPVRHQLLEPRAYLVKVRVRFTSPAASQVVLHAEVTSQQKTYEWHLTGQQGDPVEVRGVIVQTLQS